MKKLFICCPTEGRAKEEVFKSVEKIHQYAELVTGEKLEVLPLSDNENNKAVNGDNETLNVLFANMMFLKKADYIVFPERLYGLPVEFERIARIELHAAETSGLKPIAIPEIAMDTFFPDMINDIPVNDIPVNDIPVKGRKCCSSTTAHDPLRPIHLKPDRSTCDTPTCDTPTCDRPAPTCDIPG